MNGPTLTAALITLNEERHLRDLLPRLDWTDEIVVVDGGSRDATAQVADDHGCRVAVREMDDFARQRNFAIELARGDWILSIDADERPSPALVEEARRRMGEDRHAAYRVPIRSRIFGRQFRFSGTQDDRPVRLFRRDAGRWLGEVHEKLAISGAIGRLRGWLDHDTLPDLPAFLAKVRRYTSLEAERRVRSGIPPRWTDRWLAPPKEVFRRLAWKKGLLDGPQGWAFCLLSGLSQWVLADVHRRLWQESGRGFDGRPAPQLQYSPKKCA